MVGGMETGIKASPLLSFVQNLENKLHPKTQSI